MARFSIGTAIGEALSLIRRRPVSVFVWGLLLLAPAAATFGVMLPMMGDMFRETALEAAGDGVVQQPAFADMMQLQAVTGLLNIVQLLVTVIVYTAVMRAVLRPGESSVFSLRLGMDEVRVAVVGIAVVVGVYLAAIVLTLIGVAIGFAVWGLGAPMNWLIVTGLVVTAVLAIWLAAARVSLIAPASLLYRRFAFPEGWRLGRGQTGALFGMMLLLILLMIVIEVVVIGVGLAVAIAAGLTGGLDWTALHAEGRAAVHAHNVNVNPFEGMEAAFAAHWPWFAVAAVLAAMVYGVLSTLYVAPFASACRQLAQGDKPPLADAQSPAPVE